eukprot:9427512-Pyramimonas_sp.AAC.1
MQPIWPRAAAPRSAAPLTGKGGDGERSELGLPWRTPIRFPSRWGRRIPPRRRRIASASVVRR